MDVIYEDNHLLVISKPAGLTTQGASNEPSVYEEAKAFLKRKYAKPGNVYLGIVSRLDKRTSGVLVLAKTSKAASRLSQQFREGTPSKQYLAVIEGELEPGDSTQTLSDWLIKSERDQRMRVVSKEHPEAQQAKLRFQALECRKGLTLVQVELLTGRKHQIRVQLANAGHTIFGDQKYGSERRFEQAIALHSMRIRIVHPTQKSNLEFAAPIPDTWSRFGFQAVHDFKHGRD